MSLPKVADVEKESLYGYVFGVSGPGKINGMVCDQLNCFCKCFGGSVSASLEVHVLLCIWGL